MNKDKSYSTDSEGKDILDYIFKDSSMLYQEIAPNGWINSEYIHFFHPTPQQQYEEHKNITNNINRLLKKKNQEENEYANESEFKQEEFLYVLGLAIYDIFSNNHEVVGFDDKIYDFGSFRGSGSFIADYFNEKFAGLPKQYDYIDFYMGTIGIKLRANLMPFYEFVFHKLKKLNCDWNYFFPRIFIIDPKKAFESAVDNVLENYDPEQAVLKDIESSKTEKLQEKLNEAYQDEYKEAKYKPLDCIIQAYKNVYGILPNGHPQKEFE